MISAERNGYVLSLLATFAVRVWESLPAADYDEVRTIIENGADLALDTDREVEACVGELVLARGGTWVESK